MSQHNSLMEWLEQTKRLSKEEDYMGLEIIDTVMNNLWIVSQELIRRHRKFFNTLCDRYHKPNPVHLMSNGGEMKELFIKEHKGMTFRKWQSSLCRRPIDYPAGGCRAFKYFRKEITDQIDIQIERYKKAEKIITWQWFEVIDFMFERPELVNPMLLDDYITTKITEVCEEHKKNNPLKNGIYFRFGKYWKDTEGKWHKERRKRF